MEGIAWPVCKAEKWTMKFRDQTKKDQDEANNVMRDYQRNRGAAEAAQPEDRPPFVNKARKALDDAGVKFTYLEFGSYVSQWKQRLALKLWAGFPTFPMVFVDGTLVGGHAELAALDAAGALPR